MRTPIPYFLRTWAVSIKSSDGTTVTVSSDQHPALRVLFKVKTYMLMTVWQAEITIYNMGSQQAAGIVKGAAASNTNNNSQLWNFGKPLQMGDVVTLNAGYEADGGSTNQIYQGNLLQSFQTRENVTDTKLVLRCVSNLALNSFASINITRASGQSDWDVLQQIVAGAADPQHGNSSPRIPTDIDEASQAALQQSKDPGSQTIRERPLLSLAKIADQNNIFAWMDQDGLHMRTFTEDNVPTPRFIYGPPNMSKPSGQQPTTAKPTILGVPEQTEDGVVFTTLMDSAVKIGDPIQIDLSSTAINAFQFQYQQQRPALPNTAGVYFVAGKDMQGDTRGSGGDWITRIYAQTPKWFGVFIQSRSVIK